MKEVDYEWYGMKRGLATGPLNGYALELTTKYK